MKTLLLTLGLMLPLPDRLEAPAPFPEDRTMDSICANLVLWQESMKRDGYPEGNYRGTGMEKFCPGMV